MQFQDRSYGGKIFRPHPEVLFDQEGGLLLITTPWGPRAHAQKVNAMLRDQFFSSQADSEITAPFEKLTCLSPTANDLRMALKLANDRIYNEVNKEEYIFGFEILVMVITEQELTWSQLGYPNLFLDRANCSLQAIGTQHDMSTEMGHPKDPMAPLPSQMLGCDPSSDFATRSFRPQSSERLLFLSRGFLPQSLFALDYGSRSLESIATAFSEDDADAPFWLGELLL